MNEFRRLTDQVSLPLEAVAEAVGRSYATVAAYRNGARDVPPEVYARLAEFIERHAEHLPAIAAEARQLAHLDGSG